MPYTPTISGSSIIFVTQSGIYPHTTWYSSSNLDLIASGSASGYFSGSSRHLTYYSQSGSDLILTYHTEANVNNSQGIPVGSASIFTSSFGATEQFYVQQPSSSATQGFAISMEDDGSLNIFSTTSLGASNDAVGLYISSSGKIGIGTTDPQEALDIPVTVKLSTETKIPGLARSISGSFNSIEATLPLKAPINNPTFTGAVNASQITASAGVKGSLAGNATGLTGAPNIQVSQFTASYITASSITTQGDILVDGDVDTTGSVNAAADVTAGGTVVFNGCTMTYNRTGNTVTFAAGGASVTLTLR